MIIDILREEFVDERKKICDMVSASTWWQVTFQNTSILPHLPRFVRRLLMKVTPYFLSGNSK